MTLEGIANRRKTLDAIRIALETFIAGDGAGILPLTSAVTKIKEGRNWLLQAAVERGYTPTPFLFADDPTNAETDIEPDYAGAETFAVNGTSAIQDVKEFRAGIAPILLEVRQEAAKPSFRQVEFYEDSMKLAWSKLQEAQYELYKALDVLEGSQSL